MLFLNLLLALFAIGNTNYIYSTNAMTDYQQSEHVVEVHQRNDMVVNDEYGIQLYLFDKDITSPTFFNNMLAYIIETSPDFSPDLEYGYSTRSMSMLSINDKIYTLSVNDSSTRGEWVDSGAKLTQINVYKSYQDAFVSVNGTNVWTYTFNFIQSINNVYIPLFDVYYQIIAPFINQNDSGLSEYEFLSITMDTSVGSLSTPFYIFENNLDSTNTPFIDILYSKQLQNNLDRYQTGFNEGKRIGNQEGYQAGIEYAQSLDDTALTIFGGFIDVGLLPINVFLQMFNFEVFGISISGIVSAIITITLVLIIIRFITGKKE